MSLAQKHYDDIADIYDIIEHAVNDAKTPITNNFLINKFKANNIKSILDMTCGTGIQTIALAQEGFDIIGTDLSQAMIEQAKRKSEGLNIKYQQADMRNVSIGQFDGIISMFNAIGHLSTQGFEETVANAYNHLKPGGIYSFDIFNTDAMGYLQDYEYIDTLVEKDNTKYVRFTTIRYDSANRQVNLSHKTYVQQQLSKPKVIEEQWTLQTYTESQLKDILSRNGFNTIEISGNGVLDIFGTPGLGHLVFATKT